MHQPMEEYIDCVLVDICKRRFACVSDQDDVKTLECDSPDEFMRVLEVCQAFLPEDSVLWVDPAVIESKTK
jgi:hypothetical protein